MDKGMSSLEELDALILAYRHELNEYPQDEATELNLKSLLKLRQNMMRLPKTSDTEIPVLLKRR